MGATQKLLRFGVFELNLDTLEVRKSGTVVKLPPQPFKLLVLLASHAGQIVTREEIETQLWGEETEVDFEHAVNKCVKQIRSVLGDNADHPIYIETLPRQGYRFLAPVVSKTIAAPGPKIVESQSGERGRVSTTAAGFAGLPATVGGAAAAIAVPHAEAISSPVAEPDVRPAASRPGFLRRKTVWIALAVVVLAGAIAGFFYWRGHSRPVLTERDTIVLADFENKTDDNVFDDMLKQAFAIQLEQSPFLNVLSERKVTATLKLMNRGGSERLTDDLAREVCLRSNSKAVLTGSIIALGSQYVIGVRALDCNAGDVLAESQAQASGKEGVLKALDKAAVSLRGKLGESLASLQKYDTSVEEATTSSLEALKAYSLGRKVRFAKGNNAALPFFEQAVTLDPSFAMPYRDLSVAYGNLNQPWRAAENARKAYALREKVSEQERFSIDANYYTRVTGELDKAAQVYQLWQQTYPRESVPYTNLGEVYRELGNFEKALEQARQAIRLEPANSTNYVNLGNDYTALSRLDDAEATYKRAEERKLEGEFMLEARYKLAFLQGDSAQMAHWAAAAMDSPGTEDLLLAAQAETEAWYGKLKQARNLTRRAMGSALRNDAKRRLQPIR